MVVRKLTKKDIKEVSQLIKNCYLSLNVGGHTKKGIDIQIEANSPENLERKSKNIKYFVALDKNKIIGICGYDKNKIQTLFVDINYHKKGIGKQLLNHVLKEAKDEGIKSIKTWSTFNAERFYSSFGFIKKKKIYLPEGSEDIILIEMERNFDIETVKTVI